MKVLFVYMVVSPEISEVGFQQGIGSISSVLKQNGHETSLLLLDRLDKEFIRNKIKSFNPAVIGISSTTDQIPLVRKFAKFVSDEFRLPLFLGGVHATLDPENSIKIEGLVGICRGEGEYAFLELINAIENNEDYSKIKNFWFKKGGKITKNEMRPLIKDLDSLPFPDREVFKFHELLKKRNDAEFMGSRGCPFDCSYCSNHALKKEYSGKGSYLRYRSVDNLLKEVSEVTARYEVKKIGFHDDTFTLNKKWLSEFCHKYLKRVNIPFWCNARVDTVDEKIIRMLKDSGCVEIRLAIESGNDRIRQGILKKNITNEQIINAFSLLKKYSIRSYVFNMLGLPYETEKNIKETISLNKKVKPDTIQVSVFRPYPNTELYIKCKENGWVSNRELDTYFDNKSILNLPDLSEEQIKYYSTIFKWAVKYPYLALPIRLLYKIRVRESNVFEIMLQMRRRAVHFLGASLDERYKRPIKKIIVKLNLKDLVEM